MMRLAGAATCTPMRSVSEEKHCEESNLLCSDTNLEEVGIIGTNAPAPVSRIYLGVWTVDGRSRVRRHVRRGPSSRVQKFN